MPQNPKRQGAVTLFLPQTLSAQGRRASNRPGFLST